MPPAALAARHAARLTGLALGLACATAQAQTGVDPQQRFAQLRLAAVAAHPPVGRPARRLSPNEPIPLLDCLDAGLDLGITPDDLDGPAVQTAMEVEQLGHSLRALDLPPELWQPWLDRMQRAAVDYLADTAARPAQRDQASARLDARDREAREQLERAVVRHRQQRRLPPVVLQEGCGAGEMPVEIQTRPAGGRVSYITLFRHRLCEAQQIAPTDRQRCRGWVDAVKPQEWLSGRYAYQVRWPDGRSSSGVFDTRSAPTLQVRGDEVIRVLLSP